MVNQSSRTVLIYIIAAAMILSLFALFKAPSAKGAEKTFPLKALFNVGADGAYDAAARAFAFEIDLKKGFQTVEVPVSQLKSMVTDGKLSSIAIVPAAAHRDADGNLTNGWPLDKDAVYLDNITVGSATLFNDAVQRPFLFQNFADDSDIFYSYAPNGIIAADGGVNNTNSLKFMVSGAAGASWMIYKEAIDLSTMADADKLTFSIDLDQTYYQQWTPAPYKPQPGANDAPPATVQIGPGKTYENINDFAWETLKAGDVVYVYYRETPYKEKIGIFSQGTADKPIIIHGVPGPNGELPKIDGNEAIARAQNPVPNPNRSLVRIGRDSAPAKHIIFENFEVYNAHSSKKYKNANGTLGSYTHNATGIWIDNGENITLRNNKVHDNGNGIFGTTFMFVWEGELIDYTSKNILIQGNWIYKNGNKARMFEHNSYIAAIGTIYENNHYGDLLEGSQGYGLKDRGSGTVIRYNWIEGGRRQISLDDAEDSPRIGFDPKYNDSFVYGNVLVERDHLFDTWGDDEIINFGGDAEYVPDRHGTLYFYNNTILTYRKNRVYGQDGVPPLKDPGRIERTVLFYAPGKHLDVRNNVFHATGDDPAPLVITDDDGTVELRNNWFTQGYHYDFNEPDRKPQTNIHTSTGQDPGMIDLSLGMQNYMLKPGSMLIDAGAKLPKEYEDLINREYVLHQSTQPRDNENEMDIGAFEFMNKQQDHNDGNADHGGNDGSNH